MAHSFASSTTAFPAESELDRLDRPRDRDFEERLQTYRGFVRGVTLFAAHILVILLLLYYFLM